MSTSNPVSDEEPILGDSGKVRTNQWSFSSHYSPKQTLFAPLVNVPDRSSPIYPHCIHRTNPFQNKLLRFQ
eukprot:scaffold14514_cov83-Cylindrotheca_fusiformis.AAC.2